MEYASGDPAPHFNLRDVAGRPVMLYDFYGTAHVVLAFLPAGDAAAAAAIAGSLRDAASRWRGAGAEIIAVYPGTAEAARAFSEAAGVGYPLLVDDDGSVCREYGAVPGGAASPPSLYLVDRQGDIRLVVKAAEPATLGGAIDAALRSLGD